MATAWELLLQPWPMWQVRGTVKHAYYNQGLHISDIIEVCSFKLQEKLMLQLAYLSSVVVSLYVTATSLEL